MGDRGCRRYGAGRGTARGTTSGRHMCLCVRVCLCSLLVIWCMSRFAHVSACLPSVYVSLSELVPVSFRCLCTCTSRLCVSVCIAGDTCVCVCGFRVCV